MTRESPTLTNVIGDAIDKWAADVHTHLPGRIESYDPVKQSVSVQPVLRKERADEDGSRITKRYPLLVDVPVVCLEGGGFGTTYPIAVGDSALILFLEGSIDSWKALGGDDVDPADDRRFHVSDAVAIVGLRSFAAARAGVPTDRMRMGKYGGPVIDITSSNVHVGSATGSQPTYKATAYGSAFDTLIAAIATAVSGLSVPNSATQAAAITAALTTFHTNLAASGALTSIAKVA